MSSIIRLLVFAALLSITAVCVSAQDLGSSNRLFGGAKTTTTPKTTNKPVPKPKATITKKPTSTAKKTKPAGPVRHNTGTAKPKTASSGKTTAKKVEITPVRVNETVKPRETDVPVGAVNIQLFEKLIDDGNIARDDRNYAAAETAYQRARAIKPKDARAAYGLGNLYSDQQRWEEAETAYRTALQLDPKDAIAHVALS